MNSKCNVFFTILFVIIFWIADNECILDNGFMSRGFQHYRPNLRRDLVLHWGKTGQLEGKTVNITKPGVNITIDKFFGHEGNQSEHTLNFNMEKPGILLNKTFDREHGKPMNVSIEKPGIKIEKHFQSGNDTKKGININIEKNGKVFNIERPFHTKKNFTKEMTEQINYDKINQVLPNVEGNDEYQSINIQNSKEIDDIFTKVNDENIQETIHGLHYCNDLDTSNHPCIVEEKINATLPVQDTSIDESLEKIQNSQIERRLLDDSIEKLFKQTSQEEIQNSIKASKSLEDDDSIEKLFKQSFPVLMKVYDSQESQNSQEKDD